MMTDDVLETAVSARSTPLSRADHGHDHDQDGHDHGHDGHDHGHAHGVGTTAAFRPPFSLVRLSLGGRLAIAGGLSAVLWVAVRWALMPLG
jgi:hypothetical protein